MFETSSTIGPLKIIDVNSENNFANLYKLTALNKVVDIGNDLFELICGRHRGNQHSPTWKLRSRILQLYQRGREYAESGDIEGVFSIQVLPTQFLEENSVLKNFPFELLHDGDDFLSLKYSFFRYPTNMQNAPAFRFSGSLKRALLVASNPGGNLPNIPEVSDEIEVIKKIFKMGDIQCDTIDVEEASLESVIHLLETGSYDIVHIACHAEFDSKYPDKSSIILGDTFNNCQRLSALSLRKYFRDAKVQFAFLNCCHSAKQGTLNDSAGMVDAIVRGGVPSVIGMQWPIDSMIAVEIAKTFYSKFIQGDTPDSALRKTRKFIGSIYGWENLSWVCPILIQVPI